MPVVRGTAAALPLPRPARAPAPKSASPVRAPIVPPAVAEPKHEAANIGARLETVTDANAGQRLDNFLSGLLKGVPRSWVYRVVRTGQVRVNRGRVRPQRRLEIGDIVRVPPVRTAVRDAPTSPGREWVARMATAVIYEDDLVLVLDKPSGVAVHGGSGASHGIIEIARSMRPPGEFLELAHRLDKDTSGCLILAKRRSALLALHEDLRSADVGKRYLALVRGRWTGKRKVDAALRRSVNSSGERIVRIDENGKPSTTWINAVDPGVVASLVEARPETGRTHQIRVHAAAAGHPLAGDEKYGNRDFNLRMKAQGLRRLFLHASAISFRHPGSGTRIEVSAPVPEALRRVLSSLGLRCP